MVKIIPAILEESIDGFVNQYKKLGNSRLVQIDVVDGVFASKKTFEVELLKGVENLGDFEIHLMVDKPEDWVDRCKEVGAKGVMGQVEKMADLPRFVADVEAAGMRVGLAYNIGTNLDGLEKVIEQIDVVLLLGVEAGSQGQKFKEEVLKKIKEVRKLSKFITIAVDGGLNLEFIKKCLAAEWSEELEEDELNESVLGMEFVVGSDILESQNPRIEIERLERLGA